MSTDIATRPNGQSRPREGFDPDTIELIRRTVAKDANDRQLELFLYTARTRGLDPLLGQIHAVVRKGNLAIQVGIDGLRLIAARTQTYMGNEEPVFIEGEQYPRKATVTVWRLVAGQRCAFTDSAYWAEFYPGDGADGFMWRKLPHVMLGKVAESRALRKAFPNETSGLYSDDEMHQADRLPPATPAPVIRMLPPEQPALVQPAQRQHSRVPAEGKRWSEAQLAWFWANLGDLRPRVTGDELHQILSDAAGERVESIHDCPDLNLALQLVFEARQNPAHSMSAEAPIPPSEDAPADEQDGPFVVPHPAGSIEAAWDRYGAAADAARKWNQRYPEQMLRWPEPPRDGTAAQVRATAESLERRLGKLAAP